MIGAVPLYKAPQNSRADNLLYLVQKGEYPGGKFPHLPVVLGVLDVGGAVEGAGDGFNERGGL